MTQIDGVETSEQFDFGPFNVHQFALDLDTLKSAEIVRSAGSSLYGSDALGGVVSFFTKDPSDYLGADRFHFGAKAMFDGRSDQRQRQHRHRRRARAAPGVGVPGLQRRARAEEQGHGGDRGADPHRAQPAGPRGLRRPGQGDLRRRQRQPAARRLRGRRQRDRHRGLLVARARSSPDRPSPTWPTSTRSTPWTAGAARSTS